MPDAAKPPAAGKPSRSGSAEPSEPCRRQTLSTSAVPAMRSHALVITLFALVLRFAVALAVARQTSAQWLFSQATELGCMADSILHGEGFSSPFCGHTGPSAFLGPGYPLFVSVVFRFFGPYTMHSAECILFAQALFSAATIPVTMWTARRAFGTRPAQIAGLLCALNPWLVGLETVLWESSLSILLLTTMLGLAVALMQEPTRTKWYAGALVLAIAVWVNPSLVITGLALFVTALLARPRDGGQSSRQPWTMQWVAPAMLFVALFSLWPMRNFKVLHAFVPLRSNMGYEIWQGNRSGADGFFQARLHPNVNAAEFQRYSTLGELAYMREKSQQATAWIEAHPRQFAALTLKRIACFWTGTARTPSAFLVITTTALTLLGITSLVALIRVDRKLAALFALPMLLLPLPYYISHPDFRFWCLLAPILTMLAAWWITRSWDAYRSRT